MKLVKKGAEADIYRTLWNGREAVLKIRKTKKYRNPVLDLRIRRQRTAKESRMLSFVKSFGVPTPLVYFVNSDDSSIVMQDIPGTLIHDLHESQMIRLSKEIGRLVGILHSNAVMHGDLTTSNFIFFCDVVFVIDFGLSQNTDKPEDHAVDLRLYKEILNSAHAPIMREAWQNFLLGYVSIVGDDSCARITRLVADIESRGRYAQVV